VTFQEVRQPTQANQTAPRANMGSQWAKQVKLPHNTSKSYKETDEHDHIYWQGKEDIKMSKKVQATRV